MNPTPFRVDFSVWHAFPVALPPAIKFVRFANGNSPSQLNPKTLTQHRGVLRFISQSSFSALTVFGSFDET